MLKANEILVKATIEYVERFNKTEFLNETFVKDLDSRITRIRRNILSYYQEDIQDELLTDAFCYVFGKNAKKALGDFTGINPVNGSAVKLVDYIYYLLKNASINASKARLAESREVYGADEVDEAGECTFNFMDYALYGEDTNTRVTRIDSEYISYLEGVKQELEELLVEVELGLKDVKNRKKSLASLNNRINDLEKQIEVEKGTAKVKLMPSVDELNNVAETAEEQVSYIDEVLDYFEKLSDTLTKQQLLILICLYNGLNVNEISQFLETSQSYVLQEIEIIRLAIRDVAELNDLFENDSTLLIMFNDYEKNFKFLSNTRDKNRVSVCRAVKRYLIDFMREAKGLFAERLNHIASEYFGLRNLGVC